MIHPLRHRISREITASRLQAVQSAWRTAIAVSLVTVTALAGCSRHRGPMGVDCCADIPAGAIPEPAGVKVCNWQQVQAVAAAGDLFSLYRADFIDSTEKIAPAAYDRLARQYAAGSLAGNLLTIEPSGNSELDAQRVAELTNVLTEKGINEPMIMIATPPAIGMTGTEAERVAGGSPGAQNTARNRGAPLARPGLGAGFGAGGIFGGAF